ncbi:MAG: leucine-rich repeat protein [Oscillospiraceae bacterium]|nr:leucine-rich repeat protein [Oscillospiraceae bacterium]
MRSSHMLAWLAAAVIGFSAGAVSYGCAAGAGIIAAAATGEDTTDSGLSYTYDTVTNEATITGCTVSSGEVTIPSKIGSYTVTKIGAGAFTQKYINSVTIPDTVTEIGNEAFYRCIYLKTLTLPQVRTIGASAFFYCPKLASVSAPLAETIGDNAFCHTRELVSISLPKAITIGDFAFYGGTKLESVSIPKAETIGRQAFYECAALRSLSSPKVKTVGDFAFMRCTALASFHMNNAETIGYGAFRNCTSLEYVSLPYSVTEVGAFAFADCTGMKTLQIWGPAKLNANAVYRCSSLIGVTLSEESYTNPSTVAFYHCPKLERINGIPVFTYGTDSQGRSYPVLSSDPGVQTAIRRHFGNSIDVGFANDYITALCNYVVETETDPWMNDALKAKQLHDWLVRHCEYSDCDSCMPGGWPNSVFLSYGINLRGEGIGEAVCAGYATAYSMLLASADIESHRIHGSGHEWNVVKIDGEYYQIDPTWDDPILLFTPAGYEKPVEYTYFMKSYDEMVKVSSHGVQELNTDETSYHPLLAKYTCSDPDIAKRCTKSLRDENQDGIADYDFDLDGTWFQYDFQDDLNAYNNVFSFLYSGAPENSNAMDYANGKLPEIVDNLHQLHWSFMDFVNNCGPHDQTVEIGDMATFSVSLFGDKLSYQWQYQNAGSSSWKDSTLSGANTASVSTTAADGKHGRKYRCVVTNQKGDTLIFGPGTLFVAPKITKQPVNVTAPIDSPVHFTVKANGTGLTYQWQFIKSGSSEWKNSSASGAKTATVSTTATEARNGILYRCVITNQNGLSVTSDAALLTVTPKITAQPQNVTKSIGDTAKFTVTAEGTGLTYQWQLKLPNSDTWKKSTATGAQTAAVSLSATEARNGYQYRCVITNKSGMSVTSDAAALYTAPKITKQPASAGGALNETVKFSVTAEGSGLTYQWQYQSDSSAAWKDCASGAQNASYSSKATEAKNGRKYRCIITNKFGNSVTSSAATLKLTAKITTQPKNVTAAVGNTVKITVAAEGDGLTYQWKYYDESTGTWVNATDSGAKTNTLKLTASDDLNGRKYRCVIGNSLKNYVNSYSSTLTVTPKITSQPKTVTVAVNEAAKFNVTAKGTGLTYQWQYQNSGSTAWTNCTGSKAVTASYSTTATAAKNGRKYRCVVTNANGKSVNSSAAVLNVT